MLLIRCPWCGEREESEFHNRGEAHLARPADPAALSDQEWGDYLFFRHNTRGWQSEMWSHDFGCRRWFNMARNTATGEILATYKLGEPRPEFPDAPGEPKADASADANNDEDTGNGEEGAPGKGDGPGGGDAGDGKAKDSKADSPETDPGDPAAAAKEAP